MSEPTPVPTPTPAPVPPPPVAAPTPAPPPSLAVDPGPEPEPSLSPEPASWRDDWREALAGKDEKLLGRLKRFAAPENIVKSWISAEKRIQEKQRGPARPPEDATDEEKAAWRTEMGLPLKPEAMVEALKLPDGRILGEDDKPVAEAFAKQLFAAGGNQDTFNATLAWYYDQLEEAQASQSETDEGYQQESRVALKEEFGTDFRRNINVVKTLFNDVPGALEEGGLFHRIMSSRDAEGHVLGDNPDMIKFLVNLAYEVNPVARVTPAGQGSGGIDVGKRLTELVGMMGDPASDYWKRGPVGDAIQKEYRDLVEVQNKVAARAA